MAQCINTGGLLSRGCEGRGGYQEGDQAPAEGHGCARTIQLWRGEERRGAHEAGKEQ